MSARPSPLMSGNWIVPQYDGDPFQPPLSEKKVDQVPLPPAVNPSVPFEIEQPTPPAPRAQTSALPSPLTSGNWIVPQ